MNHLTTRRVTGGLQILYQTQNQPLGEASGLDRVRRIAIGLSYPAGGVDYRQGWCYACVVAERTWDSREGDKPPSRQYILIDEIDAVGPTKLMDGMVKMKDQYLCEVAYVPNEPHEMVDMFRRAEGLTHYTQDPQACRARWPSFVGTGTVVGIHEMPLPNADVIRRDMDTWLNNELMHPDDTALPIFGPRGNDPLKKFSILRSTMGKTSFRTHLASAALQSRDMDVLSPIWTALHGLENTLAWRPAKSAGRKTSKITGY